MINFALLIMTNFIPLFPLDIVVYPGEKLNLHVFEPRYKQLITECHQTKKPFGIPTVLKSGIGEIGTLVEVAEIVQVYEDGKMDIKTTGIKVFRILEVIKNLPDKLYSGAIVNYPVNEQRYNGELRKKVISSIRSLHELMKVAKDFSKPDEELTSYDVAHHAALSLDEEYELLGLMREDQRLEYLKRHLLKVLPLVNEMETLKERIKLNGHFKEIKGFNLDL
jgi:Lon protease-like protein